MSKDVGLGPAGQVEQCPSRNEVETGLRKILPVLAGQPLVQLLLQPVEVADIAGGIFALGLADFRSTPIACLLLLAKVSPEHLLDQLLEAMPVGIGPHQPRSGAGAIKWRRHDAEIGTHDRDVEAGEMIELE